MIKVGMTESDARLLIRRLINYAYEAGIAYPMNQDKREKTEKLFEKIIELIKLTIES